MLRGAGQAVFSKMCFYSRLFTGLRNRECSNVTDISHMASSISSKYEDLIAKKYFTGHDALSYHPCIVLFALRSFELVQSEKASRCPAAESI